MINKYRLELVVNGTPVTRKLVSIVNWHYVATTLLQDNGVDLGEGWVNVYDSNGEILHKVTPV
jgi:hypothetical protein